MKEKILIGVTTINFLAVVGLAYMVLDKEPQAEPSVLVQTDGGQVPLSFTQSLGVVQTEYLQMGRELLTLLQQQDTVLQAQIDALKAE